MLRIEKDLEEIRIKLCKEQIRSNNTRQKFVAYNWLNTLSLKVKNMSSLRKYSET